MWTLLLQESIENCWRYGCESGVNSFERSEAHRQLNVMLTRPCIQRMD